MNDRQTGNAEKKSPQGLRRLLPSADRLVAGFFFIALAVASALVSVVFPGG